MATTILRIHPFDTFFFRDGKPFSMGADTWADGVFPPAPSVIYGALRSIWISEQKGGFTSGNIQKSEDLHIKGIFVDFYKRSIALPVPQDFVYNKRNNKYLLQPQLKKIITKPLPEMAALPPKVAGIVETYDNGALFRYDSYQDYLLGNTNINPEKQYIVKESKIGIGRSLETRTAEEGQLYRVDMHRFKENEHSIVIKCEGLDFADESLSRLGAEGKIAYYEKITDEQYCNIKAPSKFPSNHNHFRLCLATPAIFSNGWLPKWLDPKSFEGTYNGLNIKLIATTIGKPISIGGFDLKQKQPKTMYRAVPAGSVYWFELLDGTMQDAINSFHAKSISEEKEKEGFGITYIGI